MTVRIIEAKEDKISTSDLVDDLKKSRKIDYSGAIYTFEGFVRGKEENMDLEKLVLTLPDKEKAIAEIESIVHYIGEFYTGDSLFLVAVLGAHRNESLKALTEVIEKVKYDVEFKKEEISKQGKRIILAGG